MQNNSTWAHWRPSPTTWPPDAWKPLPTLLALVGGVVVAIGAAAVFASIGIATGVIDPHHIQTKTFSVNESIAIQLSSYLPIATYLLLVVPALSHVSLHDLGLRAPTARELSIGLAGIVVMYFTVVLIASLMETLTHRHDTEQAVALMQQLRTPVQRVVFLAIAVVLAPIVEELAFRVFLFNALSRYGPMWFAAALSGLLFGLVHMSAPGQFLTIAVPLAAGGLVLAYVYATTRCYWANVLTHAGFNAIGVIGIMVLHAT